MFEKILVPLDGSSLAEDILSPVQSLATKFGARVTLLHVVERDAPERVHGDTHLTDAAHAAEYLGGVAARLETAGIEADLHVHSHSVGDVAAAIDSHAHEYDADLIAMCKHGRSGLKQRLIGGIAEQILRGGSAPILLRTPRDGPDPERFELRTILVPLDDHHDAERVLQAATELGRAYGAEIVLVTAVPSLAEERLDNVAARLLPGATAARLRMEREDAAARLRETADRLEGLGMSTQSSVPEEEPGIAILQRATEISADLVILGTHARSGFGAWYTGSVGERVITGAAQTLLLLREL